MLYLTLNLFFIITKLTLNPCSRCSSSEIAFDSLPVIVIAIIIVIVIVIVMIQSELGTTWQP